MVKLKCNKGFLNMSLNNLRKDVRNIDNQEWDRVIKNSLQRAAMYSAMVLYKFGKVSSVPFFE